MKKMLPIYVIIVICFVIVIAGTDKAVTVISENAELPDRTCIIIDPGHGGEDGGATSCTGVLESQINLDIALRLNDLLHLLGIDTIMIRQTDCSIHTQGDSIAERKISDLKERVRIINEAKNAVLISIHQNYYPDSRYQGAQVFYSNSDGSKALATQLQTAFVNTLNPGSRRQAKKADGIYLMKHIACTGVLIECGFISNAQEESNLRTEEYQKNLCCVIASQCSIFLNKMEIT